MVTERQRGSSLQLGTAEAGPQGLGSSWLSLPLPFSPWLPMGL